MAFELGEVLIAADAIERRVRTLADAIDRDYSGGRLHLVAVLKGACFFAADLARAMRCDLSLEFVQASSYGAGAESSGQVAVSYGGELDIDGARVLLVDDIVDSGRTAGAITAHLAQRGAESVRTAALLSKPDRRVLDVSIDYLGFEIPDRFVVGYGMDYAGRYRNLVDIRTLRASGGSGNGVSPASEIIPTPYPPAYGPRR